MPEPEPTSQPSLYKTIREEVHRRANEARSASAKARQRDSSGKFLSVQSTANLQSTSVREKSKPTVDLIGEATGFRASTRQMYYLAELGRRNRELVEKFVDAQKLSVHRAVRIARQPDLAESLLAGKITLKEALEILRVGEALERIEKYQCLKCE